MLGLLFVALVIASVSREAILAVTGMANRAADLFLTGSVSRSFCGFCQFLALGGALDGPRPLPGFPVTPTCNLGEQK